MNMTIASTSAFLFNATNGDLLSNSAFDLTFNENFNQTGGAPTINVGTVTEMGFKLGNQCCTSSPNNPNSFTQPGGDADERWMTLWGANGFNTSTGSYSGATLGMDLRIRLEKAPTSVEVPAPGITAIFGLGLIGLGYMRRRKTV
jgi:hypothetical protein